MSDFGQLIEDKALAFSIRIYKLCKFLKQEKREYIISDQLFRSGTSIGANLAEAQCAISRKDFLSKVYISLKECRETLYWIKLIYEIEILTKYQYESIYNDCEELMKMLVSITKKTRANDKATNS